VPEILRGTPLPRIGLGCVTFGREIDERASFEIMDYAAANGLRVFDTAESYGGGESERIIGRWRRQRQRGPIALMTKVSYRFDRSGIREALSRSLDRLNAAYIDYYLLHRYDPVTRIEEVLEALTQAVDEGKVRMIGCSNFDRTQMHMALEASERHGFVRFSVNQVPYNLALRDIERGLLADCLAAGVAVAGYSPLGAGFLTGKYNRATNQALLDGGAEAGGGTSPVVPPGSRFDVVPAHRDIYFQPELIEVVERLRHMSAQTQVPMERLALGWALKNQAIDCVLVGARSVSSLRNAVELRDRPLPGAWLREMDYWVLAPPGSASADSDVGFASAEMAGADRKGMD